LLKKSAQNKHLLSQIAMGVLLSGEIVSDQLPTNLVEAFAWYMTVNEINAANQIKSNQK